MKNYNPSRLVAGLAVPAAILAMFMSLLSSADAIEAFEAKGRDLRITRISPAGTDVPAGRQIVFQFDRPVVPLGRMDRRPEEIPVSIKPAVKCRWRWINTRVLACQLSEKTALKEATGYEVVVNPGIRAVDGSVMGESVRHGFVTARPRLDYVSFYKWVEPGIPVVRLAFSQAVKKGSVGRHVWFEWLKGDGSGRMKTVVEKAPDGYAAPLPEPRSKGGDIGSEGEGVAERLWLVRPETAMPLDAKVSLKVEPGLESSAGPEKGVEKRTVKEFHTFPEFEFLGLECRGNDGKPLYTGKKEAKSVGRCDPAGNTWLVFSSPVNITQVKKYIEISEVSASAGKGMDPVGESTDSPYYTAHGHAKGRTYRTPLPGVREPAKYYRVKSLPPELSFFEWVKSEFFDVRASDLEDVFGRKLMAAVDLVFHTDHKRPELRTDTDTAVFKKDGYSDVFASGVNVNGVEIYYNRLTASGGRDGLSRTLKIKQERDAPFTAPLGVREMLGGGTGAVYCDIKTQPSMEKRGGGRRLFAQVTPYRLHVKIGYFNTLVRVADVETGLPVRSAGVSVHTGSVAEISGIGPALDSGVTDEKGFVLLKGAKELDPDSTLFNRWCKRPARGYGSGDECPSLFVRVEQGGDMAVLPLDGRFSINKYGSLTGGVWSRPRRKYGHVHAWGTTAQGIYKAGDVMDYKIYVRDTGNKTLIPAPRRYYSLTIFDPGGKKVHERKKIRLSRFGSFHGKYDIPENAVLGRYRFTLAADFTSRTWRPVTVLVTDFTPAPFKVVNSINGDLFMPGEKLEISTGSKLHSGGAYADSKVRVAVDLKSRRFRSPNPVAKGFRFGHGEPGPPERIFQRRANLDNRGEYRTDFRIPKDKGVVCGKLMVESSVADDRGSRVAASSTADYMAVDRLVGLKNRRWLYETGKPAAVQYIVVDQRGNPAVGTKVSLTVERRKGNVWTHVSKCSGVSGDEPLDCVFTPESRGTHRIIASIRDTGGETHSTEISAWVAGKGMAAAEPSGDRALQIIPEKDSWNVGDTARYLVRNANPGAEALITVERYGVIKHMVQRLEKAAPVIEFKVERDFAPGFYLSVTVAPFEKESVKSAYLKVSVKDPKGMSITVKPDRKTYKPGRRVRAKIRVKQAAGKKREPVELAVAVLDEAVLDLLTGGMEGFDPGLGFYKLHALDVRNYYLVNRIFPRREFMERMLLKSGAVDASAGNFADEAAAAPAGAAPKAPTPEPVVRSLFKAMCYWNPSVRPNRYGKATIRFRLPDNLTGWRIIVFGATPSDQMALGDASVKATLPTEVRAATPNQVAEGDSFKAGFSVMNRTEKPRMITVSGRAGGTLEKTIRFRERIEAAPYKRTMVYMPVKAGLAGRSKNSGSIKFRIKAGDGIGSDILEHSVPVLKRIVTETAANFGSVDGEEISEPILFPRGIRTDAGGVYVTLAPTVAGGMRGDLELMRDYPWSCWEQKLSRAVAASHYQRLRDRLPSGFKWREAADLPVKILKEAANHQSDDGGMTWFGSPNARPSPYLSAYTALAFNWLRNNGEEIPVAVEERLHGYLVRFSGRNSASGFSDQGMLATVKAAALAALAEHGKVEPGALERLEKDAPAMSLFGKALFLQAALRVEGADSIAKRLLENIFSHADATAGKFAFTEKVGGMWRRILNTDRRSNCAILSALAKCSAKKELAETVSDAPSKLVRFLAQKSRIRRCGGNTQEMVFCANAFMDYARVFEKQRPNMMVKALLDDSVLGRAWFGSFRDRSVTVGRKIKKTDPGKKRVISIQRRGKGRFWYGAALQYAPLLDGTPGVNAGIDIKREYRVMRDDKWILPDNPANIQRGELVGITIRVSVPAARHFVAVNDPIPGGLEPLNASLATTSKSDAAFGGLTGGSGFGPFLHRETGHDSVRFYAEYLPPGDYELSYTARAIACGDFANPPVYAEEMYNTEVYGRGVAGRLIVEGDAR